MLGTFLKVIVLTLYGIVEAMLMNMVKGLHHDRNDVIVMLVLTSSVRLFVFSCQKKWLSLILSSFLGPIRNTTNIASPKSC